MFRSHTPHIYTCRLETTPIKKLALRVVALGSETKVLKILLGDKKLKVRVVGRCATTPLQVGAGGGGERGREGGGASAAVQPPHEESGWLAGLAMALRQLRTHFLVKHSIAFHTSRAYTGPATA